MKLEKIVGVCLANALRSKVIEVCSIKTITDLKVDVEVTSRGVKADYWKNVVAGKEEIPEKYLIAAIQRANTNPMNYSENIKNMLEQGLEQEIIARHILGEERLNYKQIIMRFCEKKGLFLPPGFHRQLTEKDYEQSHMIVASDAERELIDLPDERITILGIKDVLGGTYQDKKPVLEEIHFKVQNVMHSIIEKYL
ncbi:MAG: hypothetical protein KKF65_00065 [Nanoarchaeota archaeon]|nr:hypothetical protein [Nanoarchaeota archaeon]